MAKPRKWVCAQRSLRSAWVSAQCDQSLRCAQRSLRSAWASAQSDQSLRCPHEETLGSYLPIQCTAKTLIRLGGCPGWYESSLGTHSFCWFYHIAAHLSSSATEEPPKSAGPPPPAPTYKGKYESETDEQDGEEMPLFEGAPPEPPVIDVSDDGRKPDLPQCPIVFVAGWYTGSRLTLSCDYRKCQHPVTMRKPKDLNAQLQWYIIL